MSSAEESELARRAAHGDHDAFAEIVRRHQSAVYNVARRLLGDRHEAEDAAQEAFLRAYRFLDRYDPHRPLRPWLQRIAVNVCLNRPKSGQTERFLDEGLPPFTEPAPGPEAQTVIRERNARLRAELLRLPPRYRVVIELRHFQELSYEEIARELNRPLSDVKSDLFRARRLLAERLKDLQPI